MQQTSPKVGIVSLGCAKALVDSERIVTRLTAEGYEITGSYEGADVVIVNTCGFLDSARAESLEAIGEAMARNGRVVVTGCMGVDESGIRDAHPTCWRSPARISTRRWSTRCMRPCRRRMTRSWTWCRRKGCI